MSATNLEAFDELKKVGTETLKRGQLVNYVLAALLLFIIGWALWEVYQDRDVVRIEEIAITEEAAIGPTQLCPGDFLHIRFNLHVEGAGVLIRDFSVQKGSSTVVFSEPLRYPIVGPIDDTVPDVWRVPSLFFDFRTGTTVEFPPGDYLYIASVSNFGRNALSDQLTIPFTVKSKEACNVQDEGAMWKKPLSPSLWINLTNH